jgi:N6-L-threonylcarbamoyladenine synthase
MNLVYAKMKVFDKIMKIFLGIETSCDETAAALIQGTSLLGHVVYSQDHRAFGGVMPQVAARQHMEQIPHVMNSLFTQAHLLPSDISGVGVTSGPGLVGGLLVGLMFAKGLAMSLSCPLWPIHHLEAHALMVRMTERVDFPYLVVLLSGGHCLMAEVLGVSSYKILGQTYDDAVGECLDKVARVLGGPYPGGPYIEQMARKGDPHAVTLPIPLAREISCHFSFSGLKTACIQWVKKQGPLSEQGQQDFSASLQRTIAESLCQRLGYALQKTGLTRCVISGGVAANLYFRQRFQEVCHQHGANFIAPPAHLCTDNGAMVAWAAHEHAHAGLIPTLEHSARASWPLDALSPLKS